MCFDLFPLLHVLDFGEHIGISERLDLSENVEIVSHASHPVKEGRGSLRGMKGIFKSVVGVRQNIYLKLPNLILANFVTIVVNEELAQIRVVKHCRGLGSEPIGWLVVREAILTRLCHDWLDIEQDAKSLHDQLDHLRGFSHYAYLRDVLLAYAFNGTYGLVHGWHDSSQLLVTFLADFLCTLKVLMHQEFFLLELLAE